MGASGLPPLPDRWWEDMTAIERGSPLHVLNEAQAEHSKAKAAATEATRKRNEWEWRVEHLQKFIRRQIGVSTP